MRVRVIVILLLIVIISVLVAFLIMTDDSGSAVVEDRIEVPTYDQGEQPQQQIVELKNSIASKSGDKTYSADAILTSPITRQVTDEGLFSYAPDDRYYEVMFFEPSGTITILLYEEPLSFARGLAEKDLLSIFPYTEEEICDMDIRVRVNQAVNQDLHLLNLGLSFCPLSHSLQ